MNKYELRAWLAGSLWIVTSACAYPDDYQEWFGWCMPIVLSAVVGWNLGSLRAAK